MYDLNQIRRVGLIHIGGGLLVALAGGISEAAFAGQSDWLSSLISNLGGLVLFGVGWFLFNQVVMGQTYANLRKGLNFNSQPMERLKVLKPPPRRFGLDYQSVEISAMVLAALLVVGVNWLIRSGPNNTAGTFSLGGFAAGWLVGGGFGRLRFYRKTTVLEREQERHFYFSDATAGPRTELAFYEEKPGKRTLEEAQNQPEKPVAKVVSAAATPPGVKRRAGSEVSQANAPVRKKAKIEPLISTPPKSSDSENKE